MFRHNHGSGGHNRNHNHSASEGKFLKSIVYGGLDGIITTFAVVAGVAGASLSSSIVLILGFANLIADGISMAVGDFLSSKAEREYIHSKSTKKASPLKLGLTTFISFILFGFIPLMIYVLNLIFPTINVNKFLFSIILTAIALFILGVSKAKITHKHWFYSGVEVLIIGGLAATAAFIVGKFLAGLG